MNVSVVDRSSAIIDALRGKLASAVQAGAFLIENQAKINSPVRTGTLRRSIHTDIVQADPDRVVAHIGPGVDYGVYVELGTRKMHARPYLRPAFESEKGNAIQEVTDSLAALLR